MAPSLDTLPNELISAVYKLLPPRDVENLGSVSRHLNGLHKSNKKLLNAAWGKRYEHVLNAERRKYWSTLSLEHRMQKIVENYEVVDEIISDVNTRWKATTQQDELNLLLIAVYLDEHPLPRNKGPFNIPKGRMTVLKGGLDLIRGMIWRKASSNPVSFVHDIIDAFYRL